jgi:hypothetical protein
LSASFEQLLAGDVSLRAGDFADACERALRGMEAIEQGEHDLALEALGWCWQLLSAAEEAWRRDATADPTQETALLELRVERDRLAVRLQRVGARALRLAARVLELEVRQAARQDDARRGEA